MEIKWGDFRKLGRLFVLASTFIGHLLTLAIKLTQVGVIRNIEKEIQVEEIEVYFHPYLFN